MILNISRRITRSLIQNSVISFDEFPIYQYGIEVMLLTVFETIGLLAFAALVGLLWESVFFMLAFCSLRVYAGGYHAKTALRCFSYFVLLWIAGICMANGLSISTNPIIINIISIMSLGIVIGHAPIAVVNRPITEDEKVKFRKVSIILAVSFTFIIGICTFYNFYLLYVGYFAIGMFLEAMMLLVEKYREEGTHEKFDT